MDLGLLGRAATAATELRGQFLIVGLLRTAVGPQSSSLSVSVGVVQRQRHAAPTTIIMRERRRRWSLRMDLGLLGRAATAATELRGRFLIVGLLRTAVGSQSSSLSVSVGVVQRQRHAAPTTIIMRERRRRWSLRMDLGLLGRAATAATELRGRFLIVGLLRTAVGPQSSSLCPYPSAWCSGSGTRRRQQ